MTNHYAVDIDANCVGQNFRVTRKPCFITKNPIVIAEGMGLSMSYLDNGEQDDIFIKDLLSSVDCVPIAIRLCE